MGPSQKTLVMESWLSCKLDNLNVTTSSQLPHSHYFFPYVLDTFLEKQQHNYIKIILEIEKIKSAIIVSTSKIIFSYFYFSYILPSLWKYILYSQSLTENMIWYAKKYNLIDFHVVHDNDIATSYFITYYNIMIFWYMYIYMYYIQ